MMPNNVLSTTPVPAAFLAPRTPIRFSAQTGLIDSHWGGIGIGDASHGLLYQVWTVQLIGGQAVLSAPNTAPFNFQALPNAAWIALAFDQNSRPYIAYADINCNASYYWYDSTIPGYRTSTLAGVVKRPFMVLDDPRPVESSNSDVLLAYVRNGELFYRQQRDRFGIEYDLGPAPATLVQFGMNHGLRMQFAFQNVQGSNVLPPEEYSGNLS